MVDALSEIRRALAPGGCLIDLRPLGGSWPVEVASALEIKEAGRAAELPAGAADDQAADQAMKHAAERQWFRLERQEFFPFYYYWDSPGEMQEYIDREWEDFLRVEESAWRNIRATWAVADADARVRIRLNMMIARWRKI